MWGVAKIFTSGHSKGGFDRTPPEPRTACIAHKRSATELRQPPGEQTLQFCIAMLQSHSHQTNEILFFQRFLLFVEFFLLI